MANKIQAEVISAISGQQHLKVRAGLSKLLSNAVANQEATCWKSDVRNGGTANNQSLRVTVWCEKRWVNLPLQIRIRKLVQMRNELLMVKTTETWWLWWEFQSLSLKQEWKFIQSPQQAREAGVFLSLLLSSSPMNEKIKIEAWRD